MAKIRRATITEVAFNFRIATDEARKVLNAANTLNVTTTRTVGYDTFTLYPAVDGKPAHFVYGN